MSKNVNKDYTKAFFRIFVLTPYKRYFMYTKVTHFLLFQCVFSLGHKIIANITC